MDVAKFLERFPPLVRPKYFRTHVFPVSNTTLYKLRQRGLEFVYVDGQPFVVTASAAPLIAESRAQPGSRNDRAHLAHT
ncbi:hypothetical protein [Bradyrhizobium sp. URHD0069]|uniref:hypothetical protein n=1 Tax=Bradyrhizobium sp. URHD0069 TaxID=1380355 RepID=UPI000496F104|nr:hypothetical protein [Bradyrhizobium sp. URHD0069]